MVHSRQIISEVVHANNWFDYKHDKFKKDDKTAGDYFYAQTKGAAMVIPATEDRRLVLVRQYRYLADKNSVEFPCGGILNKEAPSEAVKRELLEETGYLAGELIKLGEFEPANGYSKDNTSIYVGLDIKKVRQPAAEDDGFPIEVVLRRIDEFEEMIKSGEIWDGQTLAAWAIARDYIKQLP